jgi:anaerobic nitric oxide reductase transcription regulator
MASRGERAVEPADLDVGVVAPPVAEEPPEPSAAAVRPLAERVRDYQRRLIGEAVERNGGSWAAAAREFGMHRSNLHHLARRLGLRNGCGVSPQARATKVSKRPGAISRTDEP